MDLSTANAGSSNVLYASCKSVDKLENHGASVKTCPPSVSLNGLPVLANTYWSLGLLQGGVVSLEERSDGRFWEGVGWQFGADGILHRFDDWSGGAQGLQFTEDS